MANVLPPRPKGYPSFICPPCGFRFWISGPNKYPKIKKINEWLYRARCPKCGKEVKGTHKESYQK